MNTIISTLFLYLSTFIIGFSISQYITNSKLLRLGISYIVGTFYIVFITFVSYQIFNFQFTYINLLIFLSVSDVVLIFLARNRLGKNFNINFIKTISETPLFDKVVILLITTIVGFTFIHNLFWPVISWDAITLYDFRGKIIAYSGVFSEIVREPYFMNYPPYTSLLHAFSYLFGAKTPLIWYSFIYLSAIMVFYSLLRERLSVRAGLIGALLLAISPQIFEHAQIAYTNLPYAIFLGIGIILLWNWNISKNDSNLYIGTVFLSLSTWIRMNDPFILISFYLIILGVIKNKIKLYKIILPILIIILSQVPWLIFKSTNTISEINSNPIAYFGYLSQLDKLATSLSKIGPIYQYLKKSITPAVGPYFLLALISLAVNFKKNLYEKFLYFSTIGIMLLMLFIGTAMLSNMYDWWNQIAGSVTRLSSVFVIPLIYIIMTSKIWLLPKGISFSQMAKDK